MAVSHKFHPRHHQRKRQQLKSWKRDAAICGLVQRPPENELVKRSRRQQTGMQMKRTTPIITLARQLAFAKSKSISALQET